MSEDLKPTTQESKQSILDRMDAARNGVECMSVKTVTTSKAILILFLAILISVVAGLTSRLVAFSLPLPSSLQMILYSIFSIVIVYLLVKLCCKKILGVSLEEHYITKPKFKIRWIICAIILPVTVVAVLLCTPGELKITTMDAASILNTVVSAVFRAGLAAGITEEIAFRGLIMRTFEKRWGKAIAIVVPSVIFALLHSPGLHNIIDVLLLLVAGTSVGIMFSLIAYESKSIWSSAIVHIIWNVIICGKITSIQTSFADDTIFLYRLSSNSYFLTGGAFGIEASWVAVLAYVLVAVLAVLLIKKKAYLSN